MWETWVWSLGWEDPLEKGKAIHSSILAWRIPWATVHGIAKSQTWLSDFHFTSRMANNSSSLIQTKFPLNSWSFSFPNLEGFIYFFFFLIKIWSPSSGVSEWDVCLQVECVLPYTRCAVLGHSAMSISLQLQGLQSAGSSVRGASPGRDTGVGLHTSKVP